jgi:hypothetical protein
MQSNFRFRLLIFYLHMSSPKTKSCGLFKGPLCDTHEHEAPALMKSLSVNLSLKLKKSAISYNCDPAERTAGEEGEDEDYDK